MSFSKSEDITRQKAIEYISSHRQELIQKYVLDYKVPSTPIPTIFMAGSPGAGKTEFAREYVQMTNTLYKDIKKNERITNVLHRYDVSLLGYENILVHIDIDEIREFIPEYQKTDTQKRIKGNAHVIQPAAAKGMEILREYCIKEDIPFLLDGTFGNQFSTFDKMIKKLLKQDRNIIIFYIYVDPVTAWNFTQKREVVEGRNITKDNFVKQYFKSKDNVERVKEKFRGDVMLNCILKNEKNEIEDIFLGEQNLDRVLKRGYNSHSSLDEEQLKDMLQ